MSRKQQNAYELKLRKDFGDNYADLLLKDCRTLVAASLTEPANRTAKESKRIAEWYNVGTLANESMTIQQALAIVAILHDKFAGNLTVNLDNFLGYAFTRKNFEILENEGILQFFCVAQPYQAVFSL